MIARVRSNSTWIALLVASSLAGSACAPDDSDSDSAGDGEPSADAGGDAVGADDANPGGDAAGADDANPGDAVDPDGTDGGTTDTEGPDDNGTDGATDTEGTEDADPADVSPGTDTGSDTGSTLRCDLPAVVDTEVVVDTGCAPLTSDGVFVASTGRLVLQPGVTVSFSTGALLEVEGGGELVAQGTAEAVVTLQGAVAEAGQWQGIWARFTGETGSTVRLSHTVVQHGGFEGAVALGCLTSNGTFVPNTIAITDTTFADCAFYGVVVLTPNQDFEAFDRVTITRADIAISLVPDVIGSLPAQVAIDDDAVLQLRPGNVMHTQTWQPQRSPWRGEGGSVIIVPPVLGPAPVPVLTLAPGVELLFEAGMELIVRQGGLVANDVRFAAQEGGGPWGGIRFLENTTEGNLNNVQISGTGAGPFGFKIGAGVHLSDTGDRVSITNSEFVDNVVDIFVDCTSTPVLTGNMATVVNGTGC
jgi:hypothetical protein